MKTIFVKWGVALLLIAVIAGPVFLLFGKSIVYILSHLDGQIRMISISLFIKSIYINMFAMILCAVFGVFAALGIWTFFKRNFNQIFVVILLCAVIPPFIHVHSWIKAIDAINALINGIFGISLNFSGIGAVILTTAFSYLPFTTSFCLIGLFSIPQEALDMLKIEIRPKTLFIKCITPYFVPYVFISGLLVFLITMNDYAIPSVFGVNVFALELFSLFSASGNLYVIAISSLPLIILSIILLFIFGSFIKRYELVNDPILNVNPFCNEIFMKIIAVLGLAVVGLFLFVPIGSMIIESFYTQGFLQILLDSRSEIWYSFWISGLVAIMAVGFAVLFSYLWYREKYRSVLIFVLSFSFLIPSAILGLGLIEFWNQGYLAWVYQSPAMPLIGLVVRFCIVAILFFIVRMGRIEQNLIEAMHLSYGALFGFFNILIPMLWRDILACVLLVFSLAMGEYGIVLLITPPGYQMLTIKIYNYLHYGATEVVFALNLFVFIVVVLVGIIVFNLYKPKISK